MKSDVQMAKTSQLAAFANAARGIVGPEAVMTDEATCALFSVDFSEIALERAGAVVRPQSTEEVSKLVEVAQKHGVPLIPRGGGMSYTLCYAPTQPDSVILDMQGMNRILNTDLENLT